MENHLGENIRELRKQQQLSQSQLAEKMNISPQAISKWETGKSIPDILTIRKLANIFQTTIEQLIEAEYPEEDGSTEKITDAALYIPPCEPEAEDSTLGKKRWQEIIAQKWLTPLLLLVNLGLFLWLRDFFYFQHHLFQYMIIASLYFGAVSAYYLGFHVIKKEFTKRYLFLILFVNLLLCAALLVYSIVKLLSTTS